MKDVDRASRRRQSVKDYRARRKAEGYRFFNAMLSPQALKALDDLKQVNDLKSREEALERLLTGALPPARIGGNHRARG